MRRRSHTLFLFRLIVIRCGGPQSVVRIFKLLMVMARLSPKPPESGSGLAGFKVLSNATDWAASRSGISRCQGRTCGSAAAAGSTVPSRAIASIAGKKAAVRP